MSIVTSMLGKLAFIGAILPKIASVQSKLSLTHGSVLFAKAVGGRSWFSTSHSGDFNRRQVAQRAFNESLGRAPIAR